MNSISHIDRIQPIQNNHRNPSQDSSKQKKKEEHELDFAEILNSMNKKEVDEEKHDEETSESKIVSRCKIGDYSDERTKRVNDFVNSLKARKAYD